MNRRNTAITIAVAVVVLAVVAAAYIRLATPREDMGRMVVSALTRGECRSYVATVENTVHYGGKHIRTTATVYHTRGAEKVAYEGKGSQAWSLLRDGKSHTYLPNKNQVLVGESSKMLSDTERGRLLLANYTMSGQGMETVAGRRAFAIEIKSRYSQRPRKKVWIDEQFLTVLKSIDYTAAGEERGSTQTTHIQYNVDIPQDEFTVPAGGDARIVETCKSGESTDIFKPLGFQVRIPRYLPRGYVAEGYHLFNCQCNCNHRAAQLTFSDGLNIISVFQTPKGVSCGTGGCGMSGMSAGSGCAVGNCGIAGVGQENTSDRSIVVVGDLPADEIRKIVESVR